MSLYTLIMAGGSGTRFWPASRKLTPKQFLPVAGESAMLTQAIERLQGLVDDSRIFIATNREQVDAARKLASGIPEKNVIAEPDCRDTAPCIGLAALMISREDPDAVMLVAPSDHVIHPAEEFQKTVRAASDLAVEDGAIFVFGVKPSGPSTAYGYIHRGEGLGEKDGVKVFRVEKFAEKPNLETALKFVDSGEYYWNSGLYLFQTKTVLAELARHAPGISTGLDEIAKALGTPDECDTINSIYPGLEKISIDYAVTEKADNVKVLELEYYWNDIGSWTSLRDVAETDSEGNVKLASHLGIDTKNCIIWSRDDHLVGTVGISDLVIIHTDDATLVCSAERAQDVKALVDKLRESGNESLL